MMLQDLEVAAEFQVRESVSAAELMNRFADTGHVKVISSTHLLFTVYCPFIFIIFGV